MKKNFYLLLITLVTLYSCQKNDIINEYKTISVDTEYQTNKKSVSIHNITTYKDLVKFKSLEDFRSAYETLKETQINEVDAFSMKFANYSEEEFMAMTEEEMDKVSNVLDKKSDELSFSEEGIYSKFEKSLNFKSLRADLERQHTEWLNVSEPDWNINPLDHQIPLPSMQTFYNVHSEVMIGNAIYKTYPNGVTLIIKEATYEQLLDIRSDYNKIAKYKNVEVSGSDNSFGSDNEVEGATGKTNLWGCEMNKRKSSWKIWNSTRKSRVTIGIADGGAWDVVFAKNIYYKKIGGQWKNLSSYLKVKAYGSIFKFWECTPDTHSNPWRWSYSAGTSKVRYCEDMRWSIFLLQSTKKNNVAGWYYGSGSTYTKNLTW